MYLTKSISAWLLGETGCLRQMFSPVLNNLCFLLQNVATNYRGVMPLPTALAFWLQDMRKINDWTILIEWTENRAFPFPPPIPASHCFPVLVFLYRIVMKEHDRSRRPEGQPAANHMIKMPGLVSRNKGRVAIHCVISSNCVLCSVFVSANAEQNIILLMKAYKLQSDCC